MTEKRVIGRGGKLPWRLPRDLEHFRDTTMGHPMIMGRPTCESFPRRPLPGRTNIVLTQQEDFLAPGAIVVHSLRNAYLAATSAPGADEIFVVGGAEVYRQFIPFATKMYLTSVLANIDGDAFFPELSGSWRIQSETPFELRPGDEYPTSYRILRRII